MSHLDATVTGDLVRSNNFESAVAFLADQIRILKTKNVGSNRWVVGIPSSTTVA